MEMHLNSLLNWAAYFYAAHPYWAIGIAAAFVLVIFLRPKEVLKILFILLLVAVAAYVLYLIGQAVLTGIAGKQQMISK